MAIPFTVAAFLMATSSVMPRRLRDSTAIITAAGVAAICWFLLNRSIEEPLVYWFGGWAPTDGISLGIGFVIDPLGSGLALLASGLITAGLIYSWRIPTRSEHYIRPECLSSWEQWLVSA